MVSVQELRKQGFKVGVTHKRWYDRKLSNPYIEHKLLTAKEAKFVFSKPEKAVLPNGGLTEVIVTTPEGNTVAGVAECSDSDQFNKKLGVRIALGRALKKLGLSRKREFNFSK